MPPGGSSCAPGATECARQAADCATLGAQDVPLELRSAGMPLDLWMCMHMELQVSVPLELVGLPLKLKRVPPGAAGST